MIRYDPFWDTLKAKKISSYALVHKYHISSGTLYRMRRNMPISTVTINDLCLILDCRVEEIMVFVNYYETVKKSL